MKEIPDHPGYWVTREGQIWSKKQTKGKFLRLTPNAGGYLVFSWSYGRYVRSSTLVHRAVALAYLPNPENKYSVNHLDGNKLNNHVQNLAWATREEQRGHWLYTLGGLEKWQERFRGSKNHKSKLAPHINEIKRLLRQGLTVTEIARLYSVSFTSIYDIKRGRNYEYV